MLGAPDCRAYVFDRERDESAAAPVSKFFSS
jgi:hypothetical protein